MAALREYFAYNVDLFCSSATQLKTYLNYYKGIVQSTIYLIFAFIKVGTLHPAGEEGNGLS